MAFRPACCIGVTESGLGMVGLMVGCDLAFLERLVAAFSMARQLVV